MNHLAHDVIAAITDHPQLATLLIGLTAFGESFAFVSFFVPGTTILVAAGALVKAGVLEPVPAAIAGSIGAILGDAISFWIGRRFGVALPGIWPFRKHPETLERGVRFFKHYGWPSVFIGRFFGPLRAVVPLAAGMCRMPVVPFYIANVLSAAVWAPALLFSGYVLSIAVTSELSPGVKLAAFALAAAAIVVLIAWMRRRFLAR